MTLTTCFFFLGGGGGGKSVSRWDTRKSNVSGTQAFIQRGYEAKVITEDYVVERGVKNKDRQRWRRAEVDERNQGITGALRIGVIMETGWSGDRADR